MLGFDAIGRLALGQLPKSTQIVLLASAGVYGVTGNPSTFAVKMATAAGAYLLVGFSASLTSGTVLAAAQGTYSVAGLPATFAVSLASGPGNYLVTGNAAALTRDFVNWFPQPSLGAGHWTQELLGGITISGLSSGWTLLPTGTWTPVSAPAPIWIRE
jgi:hypothetical protein